MTTPGRASSMIERPVPPPRAASRVGRAKCRAIRQIGCSSSVAEKSSHRLSPSHHRIPRCLRRTCDLLGAGGRLQRSAGRPRIADSLVRFAAAPAGIAVAGLLAAALGCAQFLFLFRLHLDDRIPRQELFRLRKGPVDDGALDARGAHARSFRARVKPVGAAASVVAVGRAAAGGSVVLLTGTISGVDHDVVCLSRAHWALIWQTQASLPHYTSRRWTNPTRRSSPYRSRSSRSL